MNQKITIILVRILLLPLLGLQSCKKDKKTKLDLPPESAFVMETSGFNTNKKNTQTSLNWLHAAANVVVWNVIIKTIPMRTHLLLE